MRHDSPACALLSLSLKCNSGGWLLLCLRTNLALPKGKLHLARVPRPSDVGIFNSRLGPIPRTLS